MAEKDCAGCALLSHPANMALAAAVTKEGAAFEMTDQGVGKATAASAAKSYQGGRASASRNSGNRQQG